MPENAGPEDTPPVAPGYPAVEALRAIDVSGWEPAVVFRPVTEPAAEPGQGESE